DQIFVECGRPGTLVDKSLFPYEWSDFAQHADVRAIGPQHVTGVDDQDARRTALGGEPVHARDDGRSLWCVLHEQVRKIDVHQRGPLGDDGKAGHCRLPSTGILAIADHDISRHPILAALTEWPASRRRDPRPPPRTAPPDRPRRPTRSDELWSPYPSHLRRDPAARKDDLMLSGPPQ